MEPASALTSFGFTELESRAYAELLRHGPASGYRLSQLLGKAPANIYQALGMLTQKAAVICSDDSGDTRIYSPVPPRELFAMLERSFQNRSREAVDALGTTHARKSDERIYAIATAPHVLERARDMLARAEQIVLFDFFPVVYEILRAEVDAVRARGVKVAGIAYRSEHVESGMPFNAEAAELVESRWPGQGLILIVDGAEYLVAQFSVDMARALKAIWTDSVFLSCIFHSAVASDIRLVALRQDPSDPLRHLSLQGSSPPGLNQLLATGVDDASH